MLYDRPNRLGLYDWNEKTGAMVASSDKLEVIDEEEINSFTDGEANTLRVEFADKNMQYLRRISGFFLDSKTAIASLAFIFSEKESMLGLDEQGVNKNTLLTVVVLFVAMGFLASALILKKLLHGMDSEVF